MSYPRSVAYVPVNSIDQESYHGTVTNPIPSVVVAPTAPQAPVHYGSHTYPLMPVAVFELSTPLQNEVTKHWKIDLCEIGDCLTCLYSYFCCPCALADARTKLDESNWYVNCSIMHPISTRWLIRTAYNIPGSAHDDCWSAACLPCCTINQFLQTTNTYGKVQDIQQVGPSFNVNPRLGIQQRPFDHLIYDILYSLFCNRCAIGYTMETVGMPFWFGCCCVGVFEANSILRYHHRYRPMWDNECYPDAAIPILCSSINNYTAQAAMATYVTGMLAETNTKVGRTYGYGCNCCEAMGFGYRYCQDGCVCHDQEGRYLVSQEQYQ